MTRERIKATTAHRRQDPADRTASPASSGQGQPRPARDRARDLLDQLDRLDRRVLDLTGLGSSPNGPWPLWWDRRGGPPRAVAYLVRHPVQFVLVRTTSYVGGLVLLMYGLLRLLTAIGDMPLPLAGIVGGALGALVGSLIWSPRAVKRVRHSYEAWCSHNKAANHGMKAGGGRW